VGIYYTIQDSHMTAISGHLATKQKRSHERYQRHTDSTLTLAVALANLDYWQDRSVEKTAFYLSQVALLQSMADQQLIDEINNEGVI
jgi:hypothetical protein